MWQILVILGVYVTKILVTFLLFILHVYVRDKIIRNNIFDIFYRIRIYWLVNNLKGNYKVLKIRENLIRSIYFDFLFSI